MARLGSPIKKPEGLFFPETYVFTPGTSDFDLLRRAYQQQQQVLAEAWAERQPNLPLDTQYEALILASIIEKATGHGRSEEPHIGQECTSTCRSRRLPYP